MRKLLFASVAAALALALPYSASSSASSSIPDDDRGEYVVVYDQGNTTVARASIARAGGAVVRENNNVGVATVRSSSRGFATRLASAAGIAGVARNRVIGHAPKGVSARKDSVEKEGRAGARHPKHSRPKHNAEPLSDLQWDMAQIGATPSGTYKHEQGDKRVLVGVIDTGIDGSHPDIAPNFSKSLSRNFTTDIPTDANGDRIDGPCEEETDHSCTDAADVDDDGHGTHVASTIASPLNGLGIGGVAPKVTLVNIRAGQDSGYFFLQGTVDALTYAGNAGIDVVNMSYYVDPWLFNCQNNPADSPENQAEQRAIVTAVQRALEFAHEKNVTLVAAAGNEAIDYTKTSVDGTSPDFASEPGEEAYDRTIDPNTCLSMPSQGPNVIDVSATGISTRKSYYSSFGDAYIEVAAPGGDVYDTADNKRDLSKAVLAAYPQHLAEEDGVLNPDGTPNTPAVVRDCDKHGKCAYYQYLQGTSMASPHAVGVAALIISRFGSNHRGEFSLDPDFVAARMMNTADEHACPDPPAFTYTRHVLQADGTFLTVTSTQTCEGTAEHNGFYGDGIINAVAAVG